VTGFTLGTDFPTTAGVPVPTAPCNAANNNFGVGVFWADGFVTKINTDGGGLGYCTYLGGCRGDEGYAIAVDAGGNVFVAGVTNSADFPVTADALQSALAAGTCDGDPCGDVFLINLNATGTTLVYSTFLGGPPPTARMALPSIRPGTGTLPEQRAQAFPRRRPCTSLCSAASTGLGTHIRGSAGVEMRSRPSWPSRFLPSAPRFLRQASV
jgi:hypothetical protein